MAGVAGAPRGLLDVRGELVELGLDLLGLGAGGVAFAGQRGDGGAQVGDQAVALGQLLLLLGDAGDGRLELGVRLLDAGPRGVALGDDRLGVRVGVQCLAVGLGAGPFRGGAGLFGRAGGGLGLAEFRTGLAELVVGGGQALAQIGGRRTLAIEPGPGLGQLLGQVRQLAAGSGRVGLRVGRPLLGRGLRLPRGRQLRTGLFERRAQLIEAPGEPVVLRDQLRGQRAGQQLRAVLQPLDDVAGQPDLGGQCRPVPGRCFFS